jgi:hypothetical protein
MTTHPFPGWRETFPGRLFFLACGLATFAVGLAAFRDRALLATGSLVAGGIIGLLVFRTLLRS